MKIRNKMNFTFLKCGVAALASVSILSMTANAAFLEVDTFATDFPGGIILANAGGSNFASQEGVTGVVNEGDRSVTVSAAGASGTATAEVFSPPGFLSLAANNSITGSWVFEYTNLGSYDFSDSGSNNRWDINFNVNGLGIDALTIEVDSGSGYVSTSKSDISAGAQVIAFNFSEFSGVDFSSVDSIRLTIDGVEDGDYGIDYLAAVPEPASLLLLGMSSLMLTSRRRR